MSTQRKRAKPSVAKKNKAGARNGRANPPSSPLARKVKEAQRNSPKAKIDKGQADYSVQDMVCALLASAGETGEGC